MSPFNFTDTPKEVQTALVSMYHQLGSRACRHAAWRFLAAGKIGKAAETLCSDRTRYKARRRDEGKLLKRTGGEQDASRYHHRLHFFGIGAAFGAIS